VRKTLILTVLMLCAATTAYSAVVDYNLPVPGVV
jgi:hypothetical protein